jgi:histidinol phosphatase-like PHP family hydrolase
MRRASFAALLWPVEARDLAAAGRSLTELRAVGPWIASHLDRWLRDPPAAISADPTRRGFRTLAEARAVLAANAEWRVGFRGDLQMHTTYSDGSASVREMAMACAALGYEHAAITDHSKGLAIAHGMDEARLSMQGVEIAAWNAGRDDAAPWLLRGIEMNLSVDGQGDMSPESLANLDLVLGAFHGQLRLKEDQTQRYIAALENPLVDVIAHPRGRMYDRRVGLSCDWMRVAQRAADLGKALEIDATPDRQDLDVETLRVVKDAACWFSIGSDAHDPSELPSIEIGVAAAIIAEVPRERVLNFLSLDELRRWRQR